MSAKTFDARATRLPGAYRSRPATESDLRAVYELIRSFDIHMSGYSDFSVDDLVELFGEEHFTAEKDTWLVEDADDAAVGYAMTWGRVPHRLHTAFACTHPEHVGRGIGSFLLASVERRMGDHLDHVGEDEDVTLWNWVDLADETGCRLVEEAGFTEVRRHYTMSIDFDEGDVSTEVPSGISIRTCTEEDAPTVHGLIEETFAEHWGFRSVSYETWRRQSYERADSDLSMWFLALEGDEPVGVLVGRAMEGLGWVADLGVRKPWRKRGVGSALLRRSFADFKRRGFAKIGLGVDASNETGAVRVYEGAGMKPERVYVTYEKRYRR